MQKKYLTLTICVVLSLGVGSYFVYNNNAKKEQLAMVHENGARVMPFDLNKTMHIFKKTDTGGVEQVIAKDSGDTRQRQLIQMHLQHEAEKFSHGDFSDPVATHGKNMAGLAGMQKNASNIQFIYKTLPNGGEIQYTASNNTTSATIHTWFDSQVSDHGSDAMGM